VEFGNERERRIKRKEILMVKSGFDGKRVQGVSIFDRNPKMSGKNTAIDLKTNEAR
jgi:hypothetical protein